MSVYAIFGLGCLSGAFALVFIIGVIKCFTEDRAFRRDYAPDLLRKLEDR